MRVDSGWESGLLVLPLVSDVVDQDVFTEVVRCREERPALVDLGDLADEATDLHRVIEEDHRSWERLVP